MNRTDACTALAVRELDAPPGPLEAFERARAGGCAWLLDGAADASPRAGHSFAGGDPYLVLRAWGRRLELDCRRAVHAGLAPGRTRLEGDVLEVARALLPRLGDASGPPVPFVGGAVALFGYELAECLEPVRLPGRDDLGLPDAVLLFTDRLLAWDHGRGRCHALALGFAETPDGARRRAERGLDAVAGGGGPSRQPRASPRAVPPGPDADEAAHAKAVARVKEEIAAGNVYQACLTHRFERPHAGDPWRLYRTLRRLNPAPFACYLELPEVAMVGSSPERFLRVTPEGVVESRPIKGTRPRGRSPAEDAALRRELEESLKDRAENLMIVDLVRNDLGRVCETGSVEVPELMAIEAHPAVFQMVSTVRGRLRSDLDVFDLVRAAFPPGSMTGAPKIAAMRLLGRLEPVRRGFYSGAVGYLDARGGADLAVVIRTLLLQGGRAWVHSGGGIVADSEPAAEWRESLDKAAPLLAALEAAREA